MSIPDVDNYVDFFGWDDEGSKKNALVNDMLDEITTRYYNPSMIDIMQIMVHAHGCSVCESSIVWWEKITKALEKRFNGKYYHVILEINEVIEINHEEMSGGKLYEKFDAKGVPFFLQNFKITTLRRQRGKTSEILQMGRTDWFKISEGMLQPFEFLSTCFNIKNRYIEGKMGFPGLSQSPF